MKKSPHRPRLSGICAVVAVVLLSGLLLSPALGSDPLSLTENVEPSPTPMERVTSSPSVTEGVNSPPPSSSLPIQGEEQREKGQADEGAYFYCEGLLSGRVLVQDGLSLLPADFFCWLSGVEAELTADEKGFALKGEGIDMRADKGAEYLMVNDRYSLLPGYAVLDGRLYLPADTIAHVFSVEILERDESGSVYLDTRGAKLIQGYKDYYAMLIPGEDLFWLSRLIHSEAMEQPLAGRVGVGNVVMNRVRSEDFPNTVMGVIFDTAHGNEFEPVYTGGITGEPDELSTIAAYLCYEDVNTVGDSMYFVNPRVGYDGWFRDELEFVVSIGDHDFYAERTEDA